MYLKGVHILLFSSRPQMRALDICCGSIVLEGPCDQTSIPFLVFLTCRDDFAHILAFTGRLDVVKWPSNVYKKNNKVTFLRSKL